MKIIVDPKSDRVIGCHMTGPEAGEIIQGLAVDHQMQRHQGAVRCHHRHSSDLGRRSLSPCGRRPLESSYVAILGIEGSMQSSMCSNKP